MKITYKGEYALRALLDLSYMFESKAVVPLVDICQRQRIPEKYLEHIMLNLKKAGYVESRRGIGGGFHLKKAPQHITLGEVIRLIDGSIEPTSGISAEYSAIRIKNEDQKAFEEIWQQVTKAISTIVDHITFADIMSRAAKLRTENADFNYII